MILTLNSEICDTDPCLHSGTCQQLAQSYECTCTDAYTGINCQTGKQFMKVVNSWYQDTPINCQWAVKHRKYSPGSGRHRIIFRNHVEIHCSTQITEATLLLTILCKSPVVLYCQSILKLN